MVGVINDDTMKKLIFSILALLLLFAACQKPEDDTGGQNPGGSAGQISLTISTYNVCKPDASARHQTNMSMDKPEVRQALASTIATTQSDIIGFGELDATHLSNGKYSLAKICSMIRDYTWSLEWPNHISSNGSLSYSYSEGFAYNHRNLELVDKGYVWMSKTEDIFYENPKPAYGKVGSPARTCIWTKFKHKESGKIFWVFVTHLPTESQGGQENMAKVVNRFAQQKAGNDPAILIGDMNANPNSEAYSILTQYWTDGCNRNWGTMSGSSANYSTHYTAAQYSSARPDRRIDHLMTRGCTAANYRTSIITYKVGNEDWCPSDHLPVTATVTIQ